MGHPSEEDLKFAKWPQASRIYFFPTLLCFVWLRGASEPQVSLYQRVATKSSFFNQLWHPRSPAENYDSKINHSKNARSRKQRGRSQNLVNTGVISFRHLDSRKTKGAASRLRLFFNISPVSILPILRKFHAWGKLLNWG